MLFVKPPVEAYRDPSLDGSFYMESHGARTYAEYNYLRGGLAARVKLSHFEKVLALSRPYFNHANVIDFGCADGVFLPSLCKHFNHVVGIDIREEFVTASRVLCGNLGLENVELFCNREMTAGQLKGRISKGPYSLAFILEVLEHVGEPGDMCRPRMQLLTDVFSLLEPGGTIIVSVPKMTGLPFLVQRLGLAALRLRREPLGFGELMKATFLHKTDTLEKRWAWDHIGFNHRKLEEQLRREFNLIRRTGTFFQAVYMLQRKSQPPYGKGSADIAGTKSLRQDKTSIPNVVAKRKPMDEVWDKVRD